jgi:hypothetical protein
MAGGVLMSDIVERLRTDRDTLLEQVDMVNEDNLRLTARLEAVVRVAWDLMDEYTKTLPEEVARLYEAAGYGRCERCDETGCVLPQYKQIWDDPELQEPCDCINGWRNNAP